MKLKTKKSLSKRVKISAKGQFLRRCAGKSHLLSGKSKKRKRRLSKPTVLSKGDKKLLKKGMPYSV